MGREALAGSHERIIEDLPNMISRNRLGVILKLIVSIALVAWLLSSVGLEDALARLLDIKGSWLALALLGGVVQSLIGTLRWLAVMRAINAPLGFVRVLRFSFIGAFFNQALPSSVGGDAVRGYLVYKAGGKLAPAVHGVLLDRVVTLLALVVLVAVMAPIAAPQLSGADWFVPAAMTALALGVSGTAVLMVMDKLPKSLIQFRLFRFFAALAGDARRTFLQPAQGLWLLALSVLGHVNLAFIVFSLFRGLEIDVSATECMMLFPPVLLLQTVPISVAGWGVREGAMMALFALIGVASDGALAVSILYGLTLIIAGLPGAVLWLGSDVRNLKEAEAFGEH